MKSLTMQDYVHIVSAQYRSDMYITIFMFLFSLQSHIFVHEKFDTFLYFTKIMVRKIFFDHRNYYSVMYDNN